MILKIKIKRKPRCVNEVYTNMFSSHTKTSFKQYRHIKKKVTQTALAPVQRLGHDPHKSIKKSFPHHSIMNSSLQIRITSAAITKKKMN